MTNSEYLIRNANGFPFGYTAITTIGEINHDTGINFGILKLKKNEKYHIQSNYESAFLLLQGECIVMYDDKKKSIKRESFFDENPYALHLAANQFAEITACTECELAVSQVENANLFSTALFTNENMLQSEHRGKGLLNDTAYRVVRTIFDIRNRPLAKLVLGEVITAPGRWSSYPPHHHPQPEIYHYRFTEPQGYGHAECGQHVFKVKQYDTYKILNLHDHAQTAAPGYGMYYLWVIRHLENNPYHKPIFNKEHDWTMSMQANQKVWRGQFE